MLIAAILWKEQDGQILNPKNTITAIKNNSLSVIVTTLGLLLIKAAIIGICTSRKLQGNMAEDVKVSRSTMSKGFALLMSYLSVMLWMFLVFLYLTIWFVFFNSEPAQWF